MRIKLAPKHDLQKQRQMLLRMLFPILEMPFTDKVYWVCCSSRAGNEAFYKWFNEYIMVPYVYNVRRTNPLSADRVARYQLDAEHMP